MNNQVINKLIVILQFIQRTLLAGKNFLITKYYKILQNIGKIFSVHSTDQN